MPRSGHFYNPATTNGCGSATFAPLAGAGSISFSNGTVAANSSCTMRVNVTVPAAGTYTNTSNHLFVGSIDTGSFATDTLVVNNTPPPPPVCGLTVAQWTFPVGFAVSSPATADGATSNTDSKTVPRVGGVSAPSIAKAFSPNPIAVGGVSALTFTITNPNAGTALTGIAFSDTFPAGMEVAATPSATTTGCGSPTFSPAAGNTSVSFSGGTIAASGTCTVTVAVTATTAGFKVNITGNVTSTNGGTGNTGTATLTANQTAPLVAATKSSSFVAATNDLDGSGSLSPVGRKCQLFRGGE